MAESWWDVPAVNTFRGVATEMIQLIDSRGDLSADVFLHQVHVLLPTLYSVGLALPVKPEEAFDDDVVDVAPLRAPEGEVSLHQRRWQPLYTTLGEQLGPKWNSYREIFDPHSEDAEPPVTGSLADDLADIYCDLVVGIDHWATGNFDRAVWEWQFRFETHWSEHLTGALRAIRSLAADHGLGFPNSGALDV